MVLPVGNLDMLIQAIVGIYDKFGLDQGHHRPNIQGCGHFICFDGHQKVARPICAAKYLPNKDDLLGVASVECLNTPAYKSKYCQQHAGLQQNQTNQLSPAKISRYGVSFDIFNFKAMFKAEDSDNGECEKKFVRKTHKSAGLICGVCSCGAIVAMLEAYAKEGALMILLLILVLMKRNKGDFVKCIFFYSSM